VVIDHHLMRGEEIPAVAALVNPNRPDCTSGQGHLAAAGVTFVLLAALNREARKRGLFAERAEPDLRQWLDLAAMGAICDVTQLTGFNRALAAQGLKVMSAWRNPGLKALLDVAKSQGPASVFHCGLYPRPQINAGGRIGRSDLGARLLSTDDAEEATALAGELDALNASRKEVEREVTEAAIAHIETESNAPDASMLLVAADGWHPGVIGIVAGRLREKYRKPVVVVGIDRAANVGKGSGPLAAGSESGPRRAGRLRRGPAPGWWRPRHGRWALRTAGHDPGAAGLPLRALGDGDRGRGGRGWARCRRPRHRGGLRSGAVAGFPTHGALWSRKSRAGLRSR
jgi:single-stranded-DNA-specific exonuclease